MLVKTLLFLYKSSRFAILSFCLIAGSLIFHFGATINKVKSLEIFRSTIKATPSFFSTTIEHYVIKDSIYPAADPFEVSNVPRLEQSKSTSVTATVMRQNIIKDWSYEPANPQQVLKVPGAKILFVMKHLMGSTKMRADDVAVFLNSKSCATMDATALPVKCDVYQQQFCGKEAQLHISLVIVVKHHCVCKQSTIRQIWDPIDLNLYTPGGTPGYLSRHNPADFWGYIVSNSVLKAQLEGKGAKNVFVIPHQYSNYQERRKPLSHVNTDMPLIAFAGNEDVPAIRKQLEDFMIQKGKRVHTLRLDDVPCDEKAARSPSKSGDMFAMKAQQVDVGIAWAQTRGIAVKLAENSAQRLSNLMSVGVPTIGYAGYLANEEFVRGAVYNQLCTEPTDLFEIVYNLINNRTRYSMAQQEALQLASKHSPTAVCRVYGDMLKQAMIPSV